MSDEPRDELRQVRFICDDAAGFEFRVMQAPDGDFHLSVVPYPHHFEREHGYSVFDETEGAPYVGMWGASVRVRTPMTGGGSHEELWHALAGLFKALGRSGKLGKREAGT